MSTNRYNELRLKYASITKVSFDKIFESDTTPTKKYIEYLYKMWGENKNKHKMAYVKLITLIKLVQDFDKHLAYIEEKDIYNKKYDSFLTLQTVVDDAISKKMEKEFKKSDHVDIIFENDEYTIYYIKTHTGSLKYGYGTKWCTASKDAGAFNRYRTGYLTYVIDKTKKRRRNFEKLAIHIGQNSGVFSSYNVYDASDNVVKEQALLGGGWSLKDIYNIDLYFRNFMFAKRRITESKKFIDETLEKLTQLNLTMLGQEINFLKNAGNEDYFKETQIVLNKFISEIQNYQ